nr:exosome complex component rrp46 [Quercus suber]
MIPQITMGPDIDHHPLRRADGSARLSDSLYTVLAGVNGPVEVQRRDELPEEAAVEINLRPASGVGGPRERWLQSLVASVVRSVLLVHMYPRTLVQITLQLMKEPSELKLKAGVREVSVLPSLLNATFLALVDGGLPLATSMSSVLAVVSNVGEVVLQPTEKQLAQCADIHAFTYSADGGLLLMESSGSFDMEAWGTIASTAQKACLATLAPRGEDDQMDGGIAEDAAYLRRELEERAKAAGQWRDNS